MSLHKAVVPKLIISIGRNTKIKHVPFERKPPKFPNLRYSNIVCPSVHLSNLSLKFWSRGFLMRLKSNEFETLYTCSLWYDLSNFNTKLEFWPQFHIQMNIENDSMSGPSEYYGHILVLFYQREIILWITIQYFYRNKSIDYIIL